MMIQRDDIISEKGRVSIAKDVVVSIAAIAVTDIEGIVHARRGDKPFRHGEGMKRQIDVQVEEENVKINVQAMVIQGFPVHKVAKEVQTHVKTQVEKMTGLTVSGVNVDIQRLVHVEEAAAAPVEREVRKRS
ncbi:Asp23/Gls24 family envelope stress response protein [Candidatus Acetothermia bacterium]|nr:Asp23/Gls24 family envelope stress response protein [Candidatus Acetothermia bacterium]